MNCVRCGAPLEKNTRFCRNCGLPVENSQTKKRKGCAAGCLGTLLATVLVLALILTVAWIFVLRPYLHDLAVTQMNNAMTDAVNQAPTVGFLAPDVTLDVDEASFNSQIKSETANSTLIQNPVTHISPQQILLNFTVFGQACSISTVPKMQNGQLVATNTQVSGIIGLLLSPSDVSSSINSHIQSLQTRIGKKITNVQLENHAVKVSLG